MSGASARENLLADALKRRSQSARFSCDADFCASSVGVTARNPQTMKPNSAAHADGVRPPGFGER